MLTNYDIEKCLAEFSSKIMDFDVRLKDLDARLDMVAHAVAVLCQVHADSTKITKLEISESVH